MTRETSETRKAKGEVGLARPLLAALVMAVALVGGVGGWAATARLNAAIIANGSVKVDRELRLAQHPTGGAIAEIIVEPGDTVDAGAVLARLDTREIETELDLMRAELWELSIRAARLTAERNLSDTMTIPEDLDLSDTAIDRAVAGEVRRFADRLGERRARNEMLSLRLERATRAAHALDARLVALERQSALADEAVARNSELAERGVMSESGLAEAEASQARLVGELAAVAAEIEANAIERREIVAEIEDLDRAFAWEAHRQLREIEPRMSELELRIVQAEARVERSAIRSPVAGTVNELMVNTVGQVLPAGQTLASIVPSDARLVIEFRVETVDIDQVVIGQDARLRFLSFDQRTTPEIGGVVSYVAPASITDASSGQPYFVATARPSDAGGPDAPARLVPGMPVEVYIQTDARTPLEYLLQPLHDGLMRAMAEG
jgi:HlyD family secretion protein